MEKYLTVRELSEIIKMAPQTIYNKIYRNEFQLGIHYVKPSRKKILFKELAIINWLNDTPEDQPASNQLQDNFQVGKQATKITSISNRQKPHKNLINI